MKELLAISLLALLLPPLIPTVVALKPDGLPVGVKAGDWVKYNVKREGQPIVWGTLLPQRRAIGIKVEVLNVSDTIITARETFYIPHEEQENYIWAWDLQDITLTSFDNYILLANLSAGDKIGERGNLQKSEPLLINSTVSKSYGETTREINVLSFSYNSSIFELPINRALEFFWDRKTGFLLEKTVQMYALDYENSSRSTVRWEISDTNLWEMKIEDSSMSSQMEPWTPVVLGVIAVVPVVGAIVLFKKKRNRTEAREP